MLSECNSYFLETLVPESSAITVVRDSTALLCQTIESKRK